MKAKIIDEYTNMPISKQRKYYLRNREQIKIKHKNYNQVNKQRNNETKRIWRQNHPQIMSLINKRNLEFSRECKQQLMIILDLYDL